MTQASNSPKPISILYFPKNPFIDQVIGVKRKRRKELHKRVGGKESRDFIKPRKKKSQKKHRGHGGRDRRKKYIL